MAHRGKRLGGLAKPHVVAEQRPFSNDEKLRAELLIRPQHTFEGFQVQPFRRDAINKLRGDAGGHAHVLEELSDGRHGLTAKRLLQQCAEVSGMDAPERRQFVSTWVAGESGSGAPLPPSPSPSPPLCPYPPPPPPSPPPLLLLFPRAINSPSFFSLSLLAPSPYPLLPLPSPPSPLPLCPPFPHSTPRLRKSLPPPTTLPLPLHPPSPSPPPLTPPSLPPSPSITRTPPP